MAGRETIKARAERRERKIKEGEGSEEDAGCGGRKEQRTAKDHKLAEEDGQPARKGDKNK